MNIYSVQITHPVLGVTRTVFRGTWKEAKTYVADALKRTSLFTFVITKETSDEADRTICCT